MKLHWLLIFLFLPFASSAQVKHRFAYSNAELSKVLFDSENAFDVRYSFLADVVSGKVVTIPDADYTLEEINAEISRQSGLTIVKIDNRYYAIQEIPGVTMLDEVVVESFVSKGIVKSRRHFTLSPQKIRELPGVTDADVLFSLQQLPGVKSPNETASGLHVRGGTPDQNLVLWDNIRIYHPGHLFGMISGFNPSISQTIYFYNKAAASRFGERVSGIIDIRTADKIDSLSAEAGINGLNADALVKVPLGKFAVQLSGRKSYTEWLQTPTFDALADKVFQHTDFRKFDDGNTFGFEDYTAKVSFIPNDNDRVTLSGIAIDNHLDFYSESDDISSNRTMDIRNYGFSGNWFHKFGKLTQEFIVHYSAYKFDYGNNRRFAPGDYEWFIKRNRVTDSGVSADYDYLFRDNLSFEFGYQLSGNDVSHLFANRYPGLEVQLGQNHLMNVSHSGYAQFNYSPRDWILQGGVRYNRYNRIDESTFEPRVLLQKKFGSGFIGQLSYERKSQIVSQIRENIANDMSLENYVWILADGAEYPLQAANQFTAGLTYKTKSFLIDADLYYKTIDGITSMAFGLLHEYDSQVHHGDGFTKGFDLLVQKSAPTWRAWLTYTYQDSQNRYAGLNDGDFFPIGSDITHAVSISVHKDWGKFSASAGWFWHTGKPYSELDDNGQIRAFNQNRLPAYHRLDASAAYEIFKRKSWHAKAGVSFLNLYGRNSVISREYEREPSDIGGLFESHYTAVDYRSLGFTPNFFVRVGF